MYQFLWIFFIYAFLGWCLEVAYAALVTGSFVNRGFLNGPVCPIYGFGVVLVVACLTPLQDNALLLFAGSVVLASALEWVTGFVLEKLFQQRWWDYSDEPFNLNGYICLRFSLAWGIACLLVMEVIHPTVLAFIAWLPRRAGWAVLGGAVVGMAVDVLATVKGVLRMTEHLRQIDEIAGKIREGSDELGQSISRRVVDLSEKGEELKTSLDGTRTEIREKREQMQEGLAQLRSSAEEVRAGWKQERVQELDGLRQQLEELLADRDWAKRGLELGRLSREMRRLAMDAREDWKQNWNRETDQRKERLEKLLSHTDRTERRLMRAFPHMRSRRYKDALERLKERVRGKE